VSKADIACEDCRVKLAEMYDFAHGGERSQVVCFSCDPPKIMCPACAAKHASHPPVTRGTRT
jgi:hypothetical protein